MCESGRIENSLLSQIILVLWSGTLDSPSARELSVHTLGQRVAGLLLTIHSCWQFQFINNSHLSRRKEEEGMEEEEEGEEMEEEEEGCTK